MKELQRLITFLAIGLGIAAVWQQLQRPPAERTWHGTIAGVPYDFRMPTLSRVKERWWNPGDERLLTPHVFGVGWSINLYQLSRRIRGDAGERDESAA